MLDDYDRKLLAQITAEHELIVLEMEKAREREQLQFRMDVATSFRKDSNVKSLETRLRRKAARDITARMMSVGERILGL